MPPIFITCHPALKPGPTIVCEPALGRRIENNRKIDDVARDAQVSGQNHYGVALLVKPRCKVEPERLDL